MNIKLFLFYIVTFILVSSCATTYQNEHQHYIGIKSHIEKDHYSLATLEIMKFQENYPNSRYICELYNFEIAVGRDRDFNDKFMTDIEKRYDNKCSHLKPIK